MQMIHELAAEITLRTVVRLALLLRPCTFQKTILREVSIRKVGAPVGPGGQAKQQQKRQRAPGPPTWRVGLASRRNWQRLAPHQQLVDAQRACDNAPGPQVTGDHPPEEDRDSETTLSFP